MKRYVILMLSVIFIAIQSCNNDEDPTFKVGSITINDDDYTAGGELKLLYSRDGGASFAQTLSNFKRGDKILMKINNGTMDLTSEDFTFDWSGSSPAPTDVNDDVAEFTASSTNVTINVKVTDIRELITSHRTNGKFFTVDKTTGALTESFTPTYNSETLNEIRAFVYHPTKKLYYASVNSYVDQDVVQAGYLYTIDPATKVATRINENDGHDGAYEVWDAIVNWAVAADDSLIAVGDFNGDGNGIVKFGTDGGRSLKTAEADICCGLGILYDASTGIFLVGNGENTDDQQIEIETFTSAGESTNSTLITTFTGFPDDMTSDGLNLKAMAKDMDGVIYGILFDSDTKKSFFVKINLTTPSITYISTLGLNNANQYNVLTFVPKYLL